MHRNKKPSDPLAMLSIRPKSIRRCPTDLVEGPGTGFGAVKVHGIEIAFVSVQFRQFASRIVHINHCIMCAAVVFRVFDGIAGIQIPQATKTAAHQRSDQSHDGPCVGGLRVLIIVAFIIAYGIIRLVFFFVFGFARVTLKRRKIAKLDRLDRIDNGNRLRNYFLEIDQIKQEILDRYPGQFPPGDEGKLVKELAHYSLMCMEQNPRVCLKATEDSGVAERERQSYSESP